MADEKDRLGEKLRQKEKAEEDRFFAEREKALVEKLRKEKEAAQTQTARELARMRCPKCGEELVTITYKSASVEQCPACKGIWLDQGELQQIAQLAERDRDSWLARVIFGRKD